MLPWLGINLSQYDLYWLYIRYFLAYPLVPTQYINQRIEL